MTDELTPAELREIDARVAVCLGWKRPALPPHVARGSDWVQRTNGQCELLELRLGYIPDGPVLETISAAEYGDRYQWRSPQGEYVWEDKTPHYSTDLAQVGALLVWMWGEKLCPCIDVALDGGWIVSTSDITLGGRNVEIKDVQGNSLPLAICRALLAACETETTHE